MDDEELFHELYHIAAGNKFLTDIVKDLHYRIILLRKTEELYN